MDFIPHSSNLRAHRRMNAPGTFFITKCIEPKTPVLKDTNAREICSALCFLSKNNSIIIGSFDTRIRSTKQLMYIRNYIEQNPVRAGFVDSADQWPYSSASEKFKKYIVTPWPWSFEMDN